MGEHLLGFAAQQECIQAAAPVAGHHDQIRVHLHTLGYPIVGDPVYGRVNLSTEIEPTATRTVDSVPMCLHAWKLSFVHPHSGEWVSFEAPAPAWAK